MHKSEKTLITKPFLARKKSLRVSQIQSLAFFFPFFSTQMPNRTISINQVWFGFETFHKLHEVTSCWAASVTDKPR